MNSLSTVPIQKEFNTIATDEIDTRQKNNKVYALQCSRFLRDKDSSFSSHWNTSEEDYLSYCLALFGKGRASSTNIGAVAAWPVFFQKNVEEIISTYKNENLINNLDINSLFIKEYPPHVALNLLHSLVEIGNEMFKDARPRNEMEAKGINAFVRSKTKVLSSKQL